MLNQKFRNLVYHIINMNKVTISGEIGIMKKSIKETTFNDDILHRKFQSEIDKIKESYPFLRIETVRSLHETSINIFALDKHFSKFNFLSEFSGSFFDLFHNIKDLDNLKIRVNISGTLTNYDRSEKFLILNNGKEIYFKITETSSPPLIYKALGGLFGKLKFASTLNHLD